MRCPKCQCGRPQSLVRCSKHAFEGPRCGSPGPLAPVLASPPPPACQAVGFKGKVNKLLKRFLPFVLDYSEVPAVVPAPTTAAMRVGPGPATVPHSRVDGGVQLACVLMVLHLLRVCLLFFVPFATVPPQILANWMCLGFVSASWQTPRTQAKAQACTRRGAKANGHDRIVWRALTC